MEFNFDPSEDFVCISQDEVDACKREFECAGVEGCRRFLEGKQEEWKNVPLNVAVIGNSGVGKSSFINAIRGLTADDVDQGAAEVGVTECTTDMMPYPHPNNDKLQFWDLPGVGTPRFPKEGYLEAIQVQRYDFFLLMSSSRFTENDAWLGNEIAKIHRKYFFVRTKLGADIYNNRKSHPKTHNESAVIGKIRENMETHMKEHGCTEIPVFLIDSYKPKKFDFAKLEQRLIVDFPELKRSSMLLSMCAFSREMIRMKVVELRSRIWKKATASAAVAAVPLPGLSIAFDVYTVKSEAGFYFTQLGLDDESLRNHAALTKTDYNELKEIVNRTCAVSFLSIEGLTEIAKLLPKGAVASTTSQVIEELAKYVPIVGSIIAVPMSFGATYYMLKFALDKLEQVAVEVVTYAAENAGDQDDEDDDQ